ncbi:MAG: hypothetical protein ABIP75_04225 [Pyrinomonadaceae bacterium]
MSQTDKPRSAPNPTASSADPIRPPILSTRPPNYDMFDGDEVHTSAELRQVVDYYRAKLTHIFDAADKKALRHQHRHRMIAVAAAVFGTLAILFGLLQLIIPAGRLGGTTSAPFAVIVSEVLAASFAVIAVGLGIRVALQRGWLVERHKAERLRLLKFGALIDPSLWSKIPGAMQAWQSGIETKLAEIEAIDWKRLKDWAKGEPLPAYATAAETGLTAGELAELVAYYHDRRLQFQFDYFTDRENRLDRWDRITREIGPLFFFVSILAVLIHFVYDLASEYLFHHEETTAAGHSSGLGMVSVVLILIAASLPVLSAGLRTVRGTYEFARNSIRFHAKRVALNLLKERLKSEQDAKTVFYQLWVCEQVLESEHREWLRLMIEAEWFG